MYGHAKHRKKERDYETARNQEKGSERYSKKERRDKTKSMENSREAEAYMSFQEKRKEKKLKELYE